MFDFINVVGSLFQIGLMVIQPQMVVLNKGDVPLPERFNEVQPVVFEMLRDPVDSACRLKGVLLAYDRDWEEVIETNTEAGIERRVIPAAPGKIEGFAIVLHERVCPGKPVEKVAFVSDYFGGVFKSRMTDSLRRDASHLPQVKEFARPKWIPQVTERLTKLGLTAAAEALKTPYTEQAEQKKTQD